MDTKDKEQNPLDYIQRLSDEEHKLYAQDRFPIATASASTKSSSIVAGICCASAVPSRHR